MNLQLSITLKYAIIYLTLTTVLYYFSDRFDNKNAKYTKINMTFVKNESDEFKKFELLSQEIKFLCRNAGYNVCGTIELPGLHNLVPLFGGYSNQNISDVSVTDFSSGYANKQLAVSYIIHNDFLSKTAAIKDAILKSPTEGILEQFEKYRQFLANEKIILEINKELFSNVDYKKNKTLLSKNFDKLVELESLFKRTPYFIFKEKSETILFRTMGRTLRLVLSAILALIVIFYTQQVYQNIFKNKKPAEL